MVAPRVALNFADDERAWRLLEGLKGWCIDSTQGRADQYVIRWGASAFQY